MQDFLDLVHGTTSVHLPNILANGLLAGTSLTNDPGLADYFSEEAVEESGGNPTLIYVRVPVSILTVDYPMLEEPILFSAQNLPFKKESDLHSFLDKNGWPTPDQWEVSLELGGAVKTTAPISPTQIISIE